MIVSIVGAGVAGLTCACELVDRGIDVRVYERSNVLGDDACSRYAGGMLAPWCEQENAEEIIVKLGATAAAWWERHTDCVINNGSLVLATGRDKRELTRFSRMTTNHQQIGSEQISRLEPDLADSFEQALYFADESHLVPRSALRQLADYLEQRGVEIQLRQEVNPRDLTDDLVVDCRGFAASEDLNDLRGVKGEMLVLYTREISLSRPVRLLHPRIPVYIVPWGEGRFMVGATMIESINRTAISVRSAMELLSAVYTLHPLFGEAEIVETGVDIRPAYRDNVPRVQRNGRVLHVNGLYRHGFLVGPALAAQVADHVCNNVSGNRHAL